MRAIAARDRDAGAAGLSLTDMPYPHAAENDVIVRVHAAGFTRGELDWPGTWTDRAGRDRAPSVPGHELSGVVAELGYGTTGLTIGQRVFGLADWTRNGSLAEYTAVEARNLAPLPADIDHIVAAALPVSGLTAWQGLFDHAGLATGQTVLIHGAAGGVGSIAVQLARDVGARIIGTGRPADRDTALGLGVDAFLDLQADHLEDAGEVDVVFDVIGGDILDRSTALVRRRHARQHRRPAESPARGRAGHLLRRRTRPCPARGPRPAPPARAAQADRRGHPDTAGSARRLRPRPAHRRQDDHPGHPRLKGEQSCAECQRHSGCRPSSHGGHGVSCCRGFAAAVRDAGFPAPLGDSIVPVETATAECQGQDVHLGDRLLPAQCARIAAVLRGGWLVEDLQLGRSDLVILSCGLADWAAGVATCPSSRLGSHGRVSASRHWRNTSACRGHHRSPYPATTSAPGHAGHA